MVQWKDGAEALKGRSMMVSPGNGAQRWRSDFLGIYGAPAEPGDPQAFLIEMQADDFILPHFHQVAQFQVFVAGSGSMGRNPPDRRPVTIHYADAFTGYGPITAGPRGYSYFTLRARKDPGPVYLHDPDFRQKLRPSRKRHFTVDVELSTEPVLMHCGQATLRNLTPEPADGPDGPSAWLARAGSDMTVQGPDPQGGGGQFCLVLSGSLRAPDGRLLPEWSLVHLLPGDGPLALNAGPQGLEALVLHYAAEAS